MIRSMLHNKLGSRLAATIELMPPLRRTLGESLRTYVLTGKELDCTPIDETMEDGKVSKAREDSYSSLPFMNPRLQIYPEVTSNGHDFLGESSHIGDSAFRPLVKKSQLERNKKRINPLKIHLARNSSDQTVYNIKPSVPQSDRIPNNQQPFNRNYLQNVSTKSNFQDVFHPMANTNRQQMPFAQSKVPKHIPKNSMAQNKKAKTEKFTPNIGPQPTVKFKCRKCCSMSFKSLPMLKEHQRMCRSQAREPALSPEGVAGPPQGSNNNKSSGRVTKKVYLCSACSTYYENWNLFLHMREVHNRHICLFCLGMFSKAEKLSSHLISKHSVQENWYTSTQEFTSVYDGPMYIMCCSCDQIFTERDEFSTHDCGNVKPIPVPVLVSKKDRNLTKLPSKCPETATNGPTNLDLTIDTRPNKIQNFNDKLEPEKPEKNKIKLKINLHDKCVVQSDYPPIAKIEKTKISNVVNSEGNDVESKPISPDLSNEYLKTPIMNTENSTEKLSGGIKLTLSLNKSQSPVIINSTVDPTVGRHSGYKSSNKIRKLKKREKHELKPYNSLGSQTPLAEEKQDHIGLTTDSLFSSCMSPINSVKSTIYDNKPEEMDSLNRVPKLTVRVPKELLDKDSSSNYSSDSDSSEKLTVDDTKIPDSESLIQPSDVEETRDKDSPSVLQTTSLISPQLVDTLDKYQLPPGPENLAMTEPGSDNKTFKSDLQCASETITNTENNLFVGESKGDSFEEPNLESNALSEVTAKAEPMELDKLENTELKQKNEDKDIVVDMDVDEPPDIGSGKDEIPVLELKLDRPLDKYPLKDLLKVFIGSTMYNCIYCNHARLIAVNCYQLALHMNIQHRFSATVDSITAEELMPDKIATKVETDADEIKDVYINLETYDSVNKIEVSPSPITYECFQCYFKTTVHKELYSHNRKMHQKTILLCIMCKSNFYSYSELLCHLCPGTYDSEYEMKFRCCMCTVDRIPSAFRLMVHLRKIHSACDVCVESCYNQARLSNHVWKHKLHHLCYRCGIAYRNKPDITKHLFWKHGTESVVCKKCLQKKWPHIYHFCIPPSSFICDECNLNFTKAVCLKVHKRVHSEDFIHQCNKLDCTEKFVSKKLLSKHLLKHSTTDIIDITPENEKPEALLKAKEEIKDVIPTINLVDDDKPVDSKPAEKSEPQIKSKKLKKKKGKDKDTLPEVDLPELQLSESDSSDESDSGNDRPKLSTDNLKPLTESSQTEPITENVEKEMKTEGSAENPAQIMNTKDVEDNKRVFQLPVLEFKDCKDSNENSKTFSNAELLNVCKELRNDNCGKTISTEISNNVDISANNCSSSATKVLQKEQLKSDPKDNKLNVSNNSNNADKKNSNIGIIDTKVDQTKSANDSADKSEVKEVNKLVEEKSEEQKESEQKVLDIWNNFQKYQATVEKTEKREKGKPKTPPLKPIKRHVCESDHDYCLIPPEINGDEEFKKKKKSPRKNRTESSSSSSSSSDSDSSCSCGSNCSCSSSSGSSSSSSSDSDSSLSGKEKKKRKRKRRDSNGSAVDVTAVVDTPVLLPEPREPPIAESDLETDETETDEDFYDEHPQKLANKMYAEKRNQLMLLASVAPSDTGSVVDESSRPPSPVKEKQSSSKKRSKTKKKKKSRDTSKHKPIKINIPKNIAATPEVKPLNPLPEAPNKITISLQSNTVQIPQLPNIPVTSTGRPATSTPISESKRASKRKRVPNKFYGYSSDEDSTPSLKQYQPPKLEWRKEDLPSPSVNRSKKEEAPSISYKFPSCNSSFKYTAPITDPTPPQNFMNESMESSDSDSSDEGALEICQPTAAQQRRNIPMAPAHLKAGTSSLPYTFTRPAHREAREGESVYCYCRCPYDEVSEMIACDADGCAIEWFHFECVGIMVPPKGKWYCPDCRQRGYGNY